MKKQLFITVIFFHFFVSVIAQTYQIMTYNIRYGKANDGENHWNLRKDFIQGQIKFYKPDIFGVQEALLFQVQYLDSSFVNYDYAGVGRDDGQRKGEYSAIFYNTDKFKIWHQSTFWLSETPDTISVGWDAAMERICTYVLLEDKKSKQKFRVFNTHFDHIGEQARIESAKLIYKKISALNSDNLPVILIGDFNLEPDSKPIHFLSKKLNDTFIKSNEKPFGPTGTYNGFKFNEPVTKRIDYIFTSKNNIEVFQYAILSDSKDCKYPSDHLPVLVRVGFNGENKIKK
jgi:endonuclease/exonuclease/phosphatase family metal-dependent hydrolase